MHEGTHALDFGLGVIFSTKGSLYCSPVIGKQNGLQVFKREVRAYRAESLVDGIPAHGGGRQLIDYILKNYKNAVEPW